MNSVVYFYSYSFYVTKFCYTHEDVIAYLHTEIQTPQQYTLFIIIRLIVKQNKYISLFSLSYPAEEVWGYVKDMVDYCFLHCMTAEVLSPRGDVQIKSQLTGYTF